MVFGMNKQVVVVKILEVIIILLPLIYGLTVVGGDLGQLATPVYTPPEIGFSMGDVTSFLRNDTVILNVSITNDGSLTVVVEAFHATVVYKGSIIGEAYLEAPVRIASGEETDIQLVVDHVDFTPLLNADEDEVLDLEGNLSLTMQGVQVSAPINMTIQLKTLIDALGGV
jgi:hypothetical protein